MNLGRRFAIGSLQLGSGQLVTNAANLVMQLAIARLLGPAEFGIYALCFAIHEFIAMLGSFSFGLALVQAREARDDDFDTAFALQAAIGVAGVAVALVLWPLVASQRDSRTAAILVALAGAQLARLLWQVPEARLARDLRFGSVAMVMAIAGIVPNALAVLGAWLGLGAWSLALRDLLTTSLLLGGGLLASGWRFRAQVNTEARARLLRFGRPMFASRSIEIVLERLDNLAAGLFFGARDTGLYHQARFLSDTGFIATRPIDQLAVNLYARVQDDEERRARAWQLLNTVLLRAMLVAASVLLLAPEALIRLLLGEEWLGAAPLLRWLAFYAALLPVFQNAKNLCYGCGEVARVVRIRIAQSLAFGAAIAAAVLAGSLEGIAIALSASSAFGLLLAWRQTRDLAPAPRWAEFLRPFAALAMAAALFEAFSRSAAFANVPWPLHIALPPLLFLAALLALERNQLWREALRLRDQLRAPTD